MTIGFDASRAFVKHRTGTENYSYQLLRALSEIDKTNSYLIYLRPGQIGKTKKENWPDNFKFSEINLPRFWTQLGLARRTFTDRMDVLFVPSHTLPLIRNPKLKTVITVHDLGAEYLPSFHQLKQVLYLNLMTHYQLKTASKIIAVSKATKEDIVKKVGIESGKIEVIYEGYRELVVGDRKAQDDIERDVLRHYNLQPKTYFLFVGTIQPRKNLERVIRAFAKFLKVEDGGMKVGVEGGKLKMDENKNNLLSSTIKKRSSALHPQLSKSKFKLVLAGQKGWKSDRIYSLPKELGIEDKVVFTGRISDSEAVCLYKNAQALVYPSLFEGFGLPILEAFASGCPVITSNLSSMPEVAVDAAILVDPYSETKIYEAMGEIVKNKEIRSKMIQKGYRRVGEFSWHKCAFKTLKLLKELK